MNDPTKLPKHFSNEVNDQPETNQPETNQPETNQPEIRQLEFSQPPNNLTEINRLEIGQIEIGKPTKPHTKFQFKIVHFLFLFTVAAILAAYLRPNAQFDKDRAERVPLVLRIDNDSFAEGSKYIWTEAQVISVFKNSTGHPIKPRVKIAFYSFGAGLPFGESTVYLLPYNSSDLSLGWKLDERAWSIERTEKVSTNPKTNNSLVPGFSHADVDRD